MSEMKKLTYTETHQYTSHQGQATQGVNIFTYVLCGATKREVRWGPLTNKGPGGLIMGQRGS